MFCEIDPFHSKRAAKGNLKSVTFEIGRAYTAATLSVESTGRCGPDWANGTSAEHLSSATPIIFGGNI